MRTLALQPLHWMLSLYELWIFVIWCSNNIWQMLVRNYHGLQNSSRLVFALYGWCSSLLSCTRCIMSHEQTQFKCLWWFALYRGFHLIGPAKISTLYRLNRLSQCSLEQHAFNAEYILFTGIKYAGFLVFLNILPFSAVCEDHSSCGSRINHQTQTCFS